MREAILGRVRSVNAQLQALLVETREALAGRRKLALEDLRAMSQPVAQMTPIVAEVARLRRESPELDSEVAVYEQNLGAMRSTLEAVRCVLLARCASLEAERAHLESVTLWAEAWQRTQPGGPH